jgi:uncharacterized membrane protein YedE/YeeE
VRTAKANSLGLGIFGGHGGNIVGGAILGSGIALAGACPGTTMAELGVGLASATYVISGTLIGALAFAYIHRTLQPVTRGQFGKKSDSLLLDQYIGMSVMTTSLMVAAAMISLVAFLERLFGSSSEQSKLVGTSVNTSLTDPWFDPYANAWSPILSGMIIGLLQIPSIFLLGTHLGASSSYVTFVSLVHKMFDSNTSKNVPYFGAFGTFSDYGQVGTVLGIACGALLSASLSHVKYPEDTSGTSNFTYFIGGFLVILGARLAGGCPSGHGLSGIARMSVASILSIVFMFIGGIGTTLLVFH